MPSIQLSVAQVNNIKVSVTFVNLASVNYAGPDMLLVSSCLLHFDTFLIPTQFPMLNCLQGRRI